MGLFDFFRVNMPYGMTKNEEGEWFVFNREYKPLGWNTSERIEYKEYPVYTKYEGLTNKVLRNLSWGLGRGIKKDENGNINTVWFYDEVTNPKDHPKHWEAYLERIKTLAQLKVVK